MSPRLKRRARRKKKKFLLFKQKEKPGAPLGAPGRVPKQGRRTVKVRTVLAWLGIAVTRSGRAILCDSRPRPWLERNKDSDWTLPIGHIYHSTFLKFCQPHSTNIILATPTQGRSAQNYTRLPKPPHGYKNLKTKSSLAFYLELTPRRQ